MAASQLLIRPCEPGAGVGGGEGGGVSGVNGFV